MKSPKELGITRTQRRNLAKLAVRFRDLRRNGYKGTFNMGQFCRSVKSGDCDSYGPEDSLKSFTECGTCGCLLGHAPYLGIGLSSLKTLDDSTNETIQWNDFCKAVFGLREILPPWLWLFSGTWKSSKPLALKRIAWTLERGFPELWDEFDPYKEEYPKGFKSFKPNWEEIEKAAK
jgi:hypothetical protein